MKTHLTSKNGINLKSQISLKQIFYNFANDKNYYNEKESEKISLKKYVQNKVIKLMESVDDSQDSQKEKEKNKYMISSESENERNENDPRAFFKKIVEDYDECNSSFSKSIRKAMVSFQDENQYRRFAMIYREFEMGYLKKAAKERSVTKELEYKARAMFARVGHMSLRNLNSSSVLERSFSECIRCCSERKLQKRNVLKVLMPYCDRQFQNLKPFENVYKYSTYIPGDLRQAGLPGKEIYPGDGKSSRL